MTGETFASSVTEMVQTLYRVACSQLSIEADREDAVQETLRRAWEKRASLKNDYYLRTWVIRILLNVCHDIQREKHRMIPTADFPDRSSSTGNESTDLLDGQTDAPLAIAVSHQPSDIVPEPVESVPWVLRLSNGTVLHSSLRGDVLLLESNAGSFRLPAALVAKIERELPEYLFDFSKYPPPDPEKKMFYGKSPKHAGFKKEFSE